jgi:hypothetical protein
MGRLWAAIGSLLVHSGVAVSRRRPPSGKGGGGRAGVAVSLHRGTRAAERPVLPLEVQGVAPQVGFEPKNSRLRQPNQTNAILIRSQLRPRPFRTRLDRFSPRRGTVEGQSSGARHLADAQSLVLGRFPDGGRRNRDDGDCLAVRSEHFEFVTLGHFGARRIVLDDHPDVAGAQALLRQSCVNTTRW